jgi:hypothetical protein
MLRNRTRILFIALLCILTMCGAAFAQSVNATTGSIGGRILDSGGAVLPGVTVTATKVDTGLTRTTVSETNGEYLLSLLPPGRYRVDAELSGLGKTSVPNVTVLLGNTTKADVRLTPQVSETMTVTAAAPVVDPTQSGITQSVTDKQIENLPILSRDFSQLAQLTPGINTTFNAGITANGGRGITSDFNIDGANSNSEFFGQVTGGTRAPFTFSQAAIKEFQVVRSQYNAEYGRGVGATLNAITKSGTNDFDGEVFDFLRKKSWAATRPTTINGQPATESFRAKDSTQYGFAVGGPIVHDKLFFFLNSDGQNQKLPIIATDFTTRSEFLALPQATRDAFFTKFQSIVGYPYANELNYDQTFNQKTYLGKIDVNAGSKSHISLRDNYSNFENKNNQNGFQTLSGQGNEHDKFNQLVGQAETVFTANLFNQTIAEFERQERPIVPVVEGFPEIIVTQGSGTLTFGNLNFLPNNTTEKKTQLKDSLTWIWGQNTIKGGGEYLNEHFVNLFPRFARGQYRFGSVQNFLDNKPNRFQQGYGTQPASTFGQKQTGVFLQDSMKVTSKLNLDFGARYDRQTMPVPTLAGNAAKYPQFHDAWDHTRSALAPRFGFAYDIAGNGRSVLRGGTGKFFNFLPSILLANPLSQLNGWFNQILINCSTTTPCPTYPNLLTPAQFAATPPANSNLQTIERTLKPQQSLRSSLQFQQQIGAQYSVAVGGEYSKLKNVQGKRQLNAVPVIVNGAPLFFGNVPVYSTTAATRPYPEFGSILSDDSFETGSYKSFTAETHKLALSGSKLSWDAHYTWSKSIDQESNERSTSSTFLYDPFNPKLSQGPADFDVRHRVVFDATYELPFGLLVSGIANWRSGAPYTAGINANLGTNLNGLINTTGNLPVFLDSDGKIIDLTGAAQMTNIQFSQFLAARGAHIAGRNTYRQPNVFNVDARLSKRFRLIHGTELELIGEVFNLTNHKNLFVTGANQNAFTLNGNVSKLTTVTSNPTFGVATSYNTAVDPRQFQAAAKFRF